MSPHLDCFMHHVMWNNFKMVFLVPLLHESRLATSSELPAVKMEDVNSEEGKATSGWRERGGRRRERGSIKEDIDVLYSR